MTHRDANSSVAFVTGHVAGGEVSDDLDWEALARGVQVLVLYMALKHLEPIAGRLLAAGRGAETPVAIVSKATTPEQRVLVTTLGACVADARAANMEPPAVIVVGEVVRLRETLDWLGAGAAADAEARGRPGLDSAAR
jgi:uroporphyrin-III C-methyltransferase